MSGGLDEHAQRVSALKAHEATLPEKQLAWEAEIKKHPPWTVLDVDSVMTEGGGVLHVTEAWVYDLGWRFFFAGPKLFTITQYLERD